jgi:hypothetical protein
MGQAGEPGRGKVNEFQQDHRDQHAEHPAPSARIE